MNVKKIKIYLDTADINQINKYKRNKYIKGFTTNPTLIKKSKIKNYKDFLHKVKKTTHLPVSIEVFSEDFNNMCKESIIINNISNNFYIKIPIVNTKGEYNDKIIRYLLSRKINVNITAIFTYNQIKTLKRIINKNDKAILSIFCGRIMDTGENINILIKKSKKLFLKHKNILFLWASTREAYNVIQAEKNNFDIITVSPEIFKKIQFKKIDLNNYSIETVKQFYSDAKETNLSLIYN